MTGSSPHPWDHPCWLILDVPSLFSNIDSLNPIDGFIDLRSSILARAWKFLAADLRRHGLKGLLIDGFVEPLDDRESRNNWIKLLTPPYPSGILPSAAREHYMIVIGHLSEAVLLSNQAQSSESRCAVFIRVRGSELTADGGNTGMLTILEVLPTLPMLTLQGFLLDEAFSSRKECDAFANAVARLTDENRPLSIIGGDNGPLPPRFTTEKILDHNILGLSSIPNQNIGATLTLESWSYPIRSTGERLIVAIDLGSRYGFTRISGTRIFVENQPAHLIKVEERRMIFEMENRPGCPAPWKTLLLGNNGISNIPPWDWDDEFGNHVIDNLGRHFPLYLHENESYVEIPRIWNEL